MNRQWIWVLSWRFSQSYKNRPVPEDMIVFGEVGLSGEVRAVSMPEQRVSEAKKLGFKTCVIPSVSENAVKNIEGIRVIGVRSVSEAIQLFVKDGGRVKRRFDRLFSA